MNALASWLKREGLTHTAFGARIGKHGTTVSRIISGQVTVDRETAEAIFRETRGEITPNHVYGIGVEPRAREAG